MFGKEVSTIRCGRIKEISERKLGLTFFSIFLKNVWKIGRKK